MIHAAPPWTLQRNIPPPVLGPSVCFGEEEYSGTRACPGSVRVTEWTIHVSRPHNRSWVRAQLCEIPTSGSNRSLRPVSRRVASRPRWPKQGICRYRRRMPREPTSRSGRPPPAWSIPAARRAVRGGGTSGASSGSSKTCRRPACAWSSAEGRRPRSDQYQTHREIEPPGHRCGGQVVWIRRRWLVGERWGSGS